MVLDRNRQLSSARWLALTLSILGGLDMLALLAVVMPREWLDFAQREEQGASAPGAELSATGTGRRSASDRCDPRDPPNC